MIAVLDSMVFAAGFAVAVWVFAFTLAPALPRMVALLRGEANPALAAQPALVITDRRIRSRARPAPVWRQAALREAA